MFINKGFYNLKELVNDYNLDWDMTLREANTKILQSTYVCPKCKGKGAILVPGVMGYTHDSWETCDLCEGKGRTKEKYVAVPVKYEYHKENIKEEDDGEL